MRRTNLRAALYGWRNDIQMWLEADYDELEIVKMIQARSTKLLHHHDIEERANTWRKQDDTLEHCNKQS